MTSKAARRKRPKGAIPLAHGESADQPKGAGRPSSRPANEVAVTARLKQCKLPNTREGRAEALHPAAGHSVGQRMIREQTADRDELMRAAFAMCRIVIGHDRACGAPSRHAQVLRILAPTGAFEATAESPPPDTRTPAEQYRAAVAAWTRMHGWLGYVDRSAASATLRAVVDEPDLPIMDWPGVLAGLRCVADGLAGRKLVWRGRA